MKNIILRLHSIFDILNMYVPVRPALPLRCFALSCDMYCSLSVFTPPSMLYIILLTLPESITNLTPSIVTDVSAIFVDMIHLRTPSGG